jgi:hypothetical protein
VAIQGGRSFTIEDAWREVLPGRFHKISPAAVEFHTRADLFGETPSQVVPPPETTAERSASPAPESLQEYEVDHLGVYRFVGLPLVHRP